MRVKSGDFAGAGSFEVDIADLCAFSRNIYSLYHHLSGSAALDDIEYGSSLRFEAVDKIGHVQIYGELFGDARCQSVKFEFHIDQTELRAFSKSLYEDFGLSETYKLQADSIFSIN